MPPGTLRSRSLTRMATRVGLLHLGQSVLLAVSMILLRLASLAIFAIRVISPEELGLSPRELRESTLHYSGMEEIHRARLHRALHSISRSRGWIAPGSSGDGRGGGHTRNRSGTPLLLLLGILGGVRIGASRIRIRSGRGRIR